MKKIIIITFILILANIIPVAVGLVGNQDYNMQMSGTYSTDWWPMFRHDLSHSGYSSSTAPENNTILWQYKTDRLVSSSPAVAYGNVYVGSFDHKLYCFNAKTGVNIWNYTANDIVHSNPAVAYGNVYFGSVDKKIYCLNASTGEKIWDYLTADQVNSPTVFDNKVYFGSCFKDGKLYCLDALTGDVIWDYYAGSGGVYSCPAIVNGKVYFSACDNQWPDFYAKICCLNAFTGNVIWKYILSQSHTGVSSPAVVNGKVYIGSQDHKVYCLDAETGMKIWNYTTGYWVESSPAVAYGNVYVGSNDGNMYCLDANNGTKMWNYSTGWRNVASSPTVADGKVYFGSYNNNVYCLNAYTGEMIWNYKTASYVYSSPAVAEGKVYIGSSDAYLYCFGWLEEPNTPIISGPTSGKPGTSYDYTFVSTYPNEDDVKYIIEWGDGNTNTTDFYHSGQEVTVSHTWQEKGAYTIKAKAKDINGAESGWGYLPIEIPRNKVMTNSLFMRLLERFPNAFPIFRYILGLK